MCRRSHPRHDAFVLRRVRTLAPVPVLVADRHLLAARAVEHDLLLRGLQLLPRRVEVEKPCSSPTAVEHALEVLAAEARPRRDRAVVDREVVVGDEQLGIDLELGAEPVARLARAVGRVEREVARRELLERQPAVHAREVLGEHERLGLGLARLLGTISTSATPSASFSAVSSESVSRRSMPGPAHEPVDDDLDRVLLVALELELGRQVDDLAVDPGAREALARELVEQRVVLALAAAHDGREHLEARAVGQLRARGRRSAAASGG